MNVLCIERAHEFSPNMVEADRHILRLVAKELKEKGHRVETINEADLLILDNSHNVGHRRVPVLGCRHFDVVCSMARDSRVLALLDMANLPVLNSPEGVAFCRTSRNLSRLRGVGEVLRCPPTSDVNLTDESTVAAVVRAMNVDGVGFPCWMKRNDGCSQHPDDVVFISCKAELPDAVDSFLRRDITRVVVSGHVEGDLVKFYAVNASEASVEWPHATFFRWRYAGGKGGKFGWEEHNGEPHGYDFDEEELRRHVMEVASGLSMRVVGGDAVIDSHGHLFLIDFNDWPSFSSCAAEAAKAIASAAQAVGTNHHQTI